MQNSLAPSAAVSRAAASTSAVSRNGVACTGDSNLADWLQKWQSSGQPPVLADRMPSTSTVSPHQARRTSWARAARAGTDASGTSASADELVERELAALVEQRRLGGAYGPTGLVARQPRLLGSGRSGVRREGDGDVRHEPRGYRPPEDGRNGRPQTSITTGTIIGRRLVC